MGNIVRMHAEPAPKVRITVVLDQALAELQSALVDYVAAQRAVPREDAPGVKPDQEKRALDRAVAAGKRLKEARRALDDVLLMG